MARRGGTFVDSFAGVEISPGLADVTTPATFRNFMRAAALGAGNHWLATSLPRRWDWGYAVRVLGANAGKDGQPFFARGRMIMLAAAARARATSKGGGVNLRISIPAAGLSFHPAQRAAFTRLPQAERMQLDEQFAITMAAAINEAMSGLSSKVSSRRRSATIRLGASARSLIAASKAARSSSLAMRSKLREMRGRAFQRQREVRQARRGGAA